MAGGFWDPDNPHSLLQDYAMALHRLMAINVIRSSNAPVADVAEWMFAKKLGLALERPSNKHFDATSTDGRRFQIKSRWLGGKSRGRQLGGIRGLEEKGFDLLAAIVFDWSFDVQCAAIIPWEVVRERSVFNSRTNSRSFYFSRKVLELDGVSDVTGLMKEFPLTPDEERLCNALENALNSSKSR